MTLKCCSFAQMAKDIQNNNKKIIMFGSGVIGNITAPEILKQYNLITRIDCYLDNDISKWGTYISMDNFKFEIKSPEYLNQCADNTVILINISRFDEVREQLDNMECTRNMTAYIMPMMCIHNMCLEISNGAALLSSEQQIPKIIHYMWLGKKQIPVNLQRCIDTWKKYCPDYEIIEWNEGNYDISKSLYMKQAYEAGAYGFVPDYARLDILYNHGGFYLDTDVELRKCLDDLRFQEAFCGVEKWQVLNFGGGSGCVKGHPMIKKFLDARASIRFLDETGKQNRNTCGLYDTRVAINSGYKLNGETQSIGGMNIYAYDYFHPYDYMSGTLNETEHTYSVHHFNGGWMDEKMVEQNIITSKKYEKLYAKCLEG